MTKESLGDKELPNVADVTGGRRPIALFLRSRNQGHTLIDQRTLAGRS
jgi:hypothetical protein